jgi:predicted enzyme related to lactoylglutathione lyase
MSGKVVHFEIPFDDGDRARSFYASVFGWQVMEMPDMGYTIVSTGPTDPETGPSEPGFINGGMFTREDGSRAPNIVIDVPDIEAALKAAGEAGGSTVSERMAVGDMGFAAYFKDTEGNTVGLWQNA